MPLRTNQTTVKAAIGWQYYRDTTGFASTRQKGSVSQSSSPDSATYNHVFAQQFTLTAGGSETLDLFRFTVDFTGEEVVAETLLSGIVKATGAAAGGRLRIEPGTSNPFYWFLDSAATSPAVVKRVPVSTSDTCAIFDHDGSGYGLSGTSRNLKISNPGTATITVTVAFVVAGAILADPPVPAPAVVMREEMPWLYETAVGM